MELVGIYGSHNPVLSVNDLMNVLNMAVSQSQWYHFGVGAPPILVYFGGGWDVHWGHGILTHGHMGPWFVVGISGSPSACFGAGSQCAA